MNEDKMVSVIMPCFNDGQYIKESIASVRSQTYPYIELIIIDDGSTDLYTKSVLDELEKTGECKLLYGNHNGPSAARNLGIKSANGKYILPLDSDDIIDKTYVEKAVRVIEENPTRGVVYCYADLFGEQTGRWDLPDYSFKQMLRDNIVFITALFYKKDWERVGGFNENMSCGMEDYDFWIGILELGREIYQIPEVLFHYRIKQVSRTTCLMDNIDAVKLMYQRIYENHPTFYRKYADEYAQELRETLIEQIFLRKQIVAKNEMYERIKRIPMLRCIIKKIIEKGN